MTIENPPRLVLDFPGTVNNVPFTKLPLNTPSVKQVRISQFRSADPPITRVVFDLGSAYTAHTLNRDDASVSVTFLPEKSGSGESKPISKRNPSGSAGRTVQSAVAGNVSSPSSDPAPAESKVPVRVLSDISASQEAGELRVNLKMNRLIVPAAFTVENPPRLVLDFTDTVNKVPFIKLPLNTAMVKQVRVSQFQSTDPRITRVVFDLGAGFGTHRISMNQSSIQVIFLPEKAAVDSTVPASSGKSKSTTNKTEKASVEDRFTTSTRTDASPVESTAQPVVQNPVPSEASDKHATPTNKPAIPKSTEHLNASPGKDSSQGIRKEESPVDRTVRASAAREPKAPTPDIGTKPFVRSSTRPLGETLDRIGESVERFRKQFASVACTEFVSQTKLGSGDSVIYKMNHEFDYMILTDVHSDDMRIEESRQERWSKGNTKDLPLLVTEGFPTLLLIFHPYYQGSFRYEYSGEDIVKDQRLIKIDFKHIRGRQSTSVLHLKDKNYPLEMQGTAWIDPESNNILRIRAELINPIEEVGLQVFNSDVRYSPLQLASNSPAYWMPETATVEVMTRQQHWRNVHRFEDYRLFFVSSESEITVP
jgi:hypothetical protein